MKKTEGEKIKKGLKLLDLKIKSGSLTSNEIEKEISKCTELVTLLTNAYKKILIKDKKKQDTNLK